MTETEIKVPAPKLMPFLRTGYYRCHVCGVGPSRWDRIMAAIRGNHATTAEVRFCAGGKEPSECVGLAHALASGSCERVNSCAGVSEAHVHVTCRFCRFEQLMRTRDKVA